MKKYITSDTEKLYVNLFICKVFRTDEFALSRHLVTGDAGKATTVNSYNISDSRK